MDSQSVSAVDGLQWLTHRWWAHRSEKITGSSCAIASIGGCDHARCQQRQTVGKLAGRKPRPRHDGKMRAERSPDIAP